MTKLRPFYLISVLAFVLAVGPASSPDLGYGTCPQADVALLANGQFVGGHGRSTLRNGANSHWTAGLEAYRKQDMNAASEHFEALLSADNLSSDDHAAAAFWAYRAVLAQGDTTKAVHYAEIAAAEPLGFYSILARHVTGRQPACVDQNTADAHYPVPGWTPTAGYRIEPSLLFAIIREESGFNPLAKSRTGASGVMQLMPATAHAIARTEGISGSSRTPSISMTLGQSYLESLMDTPSIGDNLVFLTAAYNAGPGNVANWQRGLHYNDDPLLFAESIPFKETREYVEHVIGNYWVYSELLNQNTPSVAAMALGEWPRYIQSNAQLSQMLSRLSTIQVE